MRLCSASFVSTWTPSLLYTTQQVPGCRSIMSTISESHHATKFDPRPTDIIVAVMGMTGSGKSTFISHCVGVDLGIVGHGLQGYTQAVGCYMFPYSESVNVYLVDTPGFDDTNLTDSEVLKAIGVWMGETYSRDIKLSGIIYLHRITDPRMVGSAKKNLFIFKKLCGQNALKHVTLATTMWEAVQPSDGERRERELLETKDFWGYMQSKGADVERHYNNRESAMRILSKFFTEEQVITTMQRELVEGKKEVLDTAAGMELNSEYRMMEENLRRELQSTLEELKEAQKAKDEESAMMLEEYRKQVDDKIAQVLLEREDLKVTLAKMLATSTLPIVRAPGSFNNGARRPGSTVNAGQAEAGRPENADSDTSRYGVWEGVEVPCRNGTPAPPYQPNGQPINRRDRSPAPNDAGRPVKKRDLFKAMFGKGPRMLVPGQERA